MMMNELPEGILEFPTLRGYIWGLLAKSDEQIVKSIDFWFDWFVDKLEDIEMDNVNKPQHYTYGKYECIDVIKEITKDLTGEEAFCIGNAIKYLWRWKHKNGIEDIKKARWYLDRIIGDTLVYHPKDSNMHVNITTAEFTTSNDEYNHAQDYLADATNPNKCIDTSKPNPVYINKNSPRPVYQLDSEMNIIKHYPSIHAAIKAIHNKGVGYAVRHGTRCNGYYWKYAD